MSVDLNLHTRGELPGVSGYEYENESLDGCYCNVSWPLAGLYVSLHVSGPADLIALGELIRAEGQRLERLRDADEPSRAMLLERERVMSPDEAAASVGWKKLDVPTPTEAAATAEEYLEAYGHDVPF